MFAILNIKGELVTLDIDKAVKITYPEADEKNDKILVTLENGDRFALTVM